LDAQHASKALRQEKANDVEAISLGVNVVARVAEELFENLVEEAQGELRSSIIVASSPRRIERAARQQKRSVPKKRNDNSVLITRRTIPMPLYMSHTCMCKGNARILVC